VAPVVAMSIGYRNGNECLGIWVWLGDWRGLASINLHLLAERVSITSPFGQRTGKGQCLCTHRYTYLLFNFCQVNYN